MDKTTLDTHRRTTKLFNAPSEVGLRGLIVLDALRPEHLDFQKLLYFDYLLVNSADLEGGPPSLHAGVPFRSSSVSVRRKDLQDGLELLVARDLVLKHFVPESGLTYSATELARTFLDYFKTEYFYDLVERAKWLKQSLGSKDAKALSTVFKEKIGTWDSEFSRESSTRGDWYQTNVD